MARRLLVDTDVLIDYLREAADAAKFLEAATEPLLISVVTVGELFAGVREGKERRKLETFLEAFEVVPLDQETATRGGLFRRDYGKSHGVGLADALIAASSVSTGSVVVTLNRKHFPMLDDVVVPYQKGSAES
jgi:predicted nucleic acid-binding protein